MIPFGQNDAAGGCEKDYRGRIPTPKNLKNSGFLKLAIG